MNCRGKTRGEEDIQRVLVLALGGCLGFDVGEGRAKRWRLGRIFGLVVLELGSVDQDVELRQGEVDVTWDVGEDGLQWVAQLLAT